MIIFERLLFILLLVGLVYFYMTDTKFERWLDSKFRPKPTDAAGLQAEADRLALEKATTEALLKETKTSLNREKRKLNKINLNTP
jgi:hypothetical protein